MGLPLSGGHELYSHADALGHAGGNRTRYAIGSDAIVVLPHTEPDRGHLCEYHAVIAARFGDFLVFLSGSLYWRLAGRQ